MRTYTKDELAEIVRQHNEWIKDNSKGKRADLSGANLSWADLSRADLSWADLSWANLSRADLSKQYIQVSRIGSRKGMTTYCYDDDKVWCGCWSGTLKEFAERTKETYPDKKNQHRKEYEAFIKFLRACAEGKEKGK